MTSVALEGITVLTDDVGRLATFFEEGLGFEVAVREEQYVAFVDRGVRLAIFRRVLTGRTPTAIRPSRDLQARRRSS